jgi:hypothetical protein
LNLDGLDLEILEDPSDDSPDSEPWPDISLCVLLELIRKKFGAWAQAKRELT